MEVELTPIENEEWQSLMNQPPEKSLKIPVKVQALKLGTYVAFLVLNIIAIICTFAVNGGIPEPNVVKEAFGANMICLFYDFPPASYILPPFWAICVLMGTSYTLTSILRARLAQVENQISLRHQIFFNISSLGLTIALVIFSICLAVQPDVDQSPGPEDFTTLKIHTYPFTNLMVWLVLDQFSLVWFGLMTGWTGMDENSEPIFPQWYKTISVVHVTLQGLQVSIHIFYQLNGLLGQYGEGWFISPKNPAWQSFGTVSGALFLVLSFFVPLFQSIYEVTRNSSPFLVISVSNNTGEMNVENIPVAQPDRLEFSR